VTIGLLLACLPGKKTFLSMCLYVRRPFLRPLILVPGVWERFALLSKSLPPHGYRKEPDNYFTRFLQKRYQIWRQFYTTIFERRISEAPTDFISSHVHSELMLASIFVRTHTQFSSTAVPTLTYGG